MTNPQALPNEATQALRMRCELFGAQPAAQGSPEALHLLAELCDALERGEVRAARPDPAAGSPGWSSEPWVKRALVHLASAGSLAPQPGVLPGTELSSLGWIEPRSLAHRVPAGSFLRRGACLSPGVTVMPPSTIQAGAWLGPGVRVDSHVLVGSCAQVSEDCVLGPGTILAGLLQPAETLPVILEREVILSGACGVYGSVHVGRETVLHPGTILQASAGLYDSRNARWITAGPSGTLEVPAQVEIAMALPPAEACRNGIQRLTAIILERDSRD